MKFKFSDPDEAFATARRRILNNALRRHQRSLNLRGFGLTSVPPEIGELSGLKVLYLDNNRLRTLPVEIEGLKSLEELYATRNEINSIPTALCRISKLNALRLGYNKLAALPDCIGELDQLEDLDIDHNEIGSIPRGLGSASKLASLDISHNRVETLEFGPHQYENLSMLSAANNKIREIRGTAPKCLTYVDIDGNVLSEFPIDVFATAPIEYLHLAHNAIRSIPKEIGILDNLVYLNVSYNRLESVPRDINSLVKLSELNLKGNKITKLPQEIGWIKSLEDAVGIDESIFGGGIDIRDNPLSAPLLDIAAQGQPKSTIDLLSYLRGEIDDYSLAERLKARADASDQATAADPPGEPLPSDRPAVRFTVSAEQIDALPADRWETNQERGARYLRNARTLAQSLQDRLAKTDAAATVQVAIDALLQLLDADLDCVDPDLLRMAARSIESKARAYSHPQAEWEIGADAVDALFELDAALRDLQVFAPTALTENELAIRALGLNGETMAATTESLDAISDLVASMPDIVSDRAITSFQVGTLAQSSAEMGEDARLIAGERLLVAENLIFAIARHLSGVSSDARVPGDVSSRSDTSHEENPAAPKKTGRKRPKISKRKTGRFRDVWGRTLDRVQTSLPQKLGDEIVHDLIAAYRMGKQSIVPLGAGLSAWTMGLPTIQSGGAVGVAWLLHLMYKAVRGRRSERV